MDQRHAGKIAVITGASRGIGRDVALRLAREGAAITVAAKSDSPHPKLPGTIGETVADIEKAGGKAIAIKVDVRDEAQIKAMMDQTIERFGRIDYVFNNAGAIYLADVKDTPAKRFDLMMQVNARAAYLTSHYALPHMIKQQYGHILMFSPGLHNNPSPGRGTYVVSKFGMTRIALAVAEEHRSDNIAANALWPVTMIESHATIENHFGDPSQWRKAEIICDAVSEIFSRPPADLTARMLTDEEILRESGVTNFDHYWVEGKPPAEPLLIGGPGSMFT